MVYTSTLPRSVQTAQPILERYGVTGYEEISALNMMDTGVFHSMTTDEIRSRMPEELAKWEQQKFRYRFPGGESQQDVASSLEHIILELERQTLPVLVISHASTLQVLYGYFLGIDCPVDEYFSLNIPRHTVIELIPNQYGWQENRYNLEPAPSSEDSGESPSPASAGSNPSPLDSLSMLSSPSPLANGTDSYIFDHDHLPSSLARSLSADLLAHSQRAKLSPMNVIKLNDQTHSSKFYD